MQRPGHVVLEVGCLAQLGAGQRLDMIRPAPAWLQGEPADLGAADLEQVQGTVVEAAGLVGRGEALLFRFPAHRDLPSSVERSGDQRGRPRLQSACTGLAGIRPPGFAARAVFCVCQKIASRPFTCVNTNCERACRGRSRTRSIAGQGSSKRWQ